MNLNYMGSLAQTNMRFRSTTEVVVNNTNELFNAQSIYIPKRFAPQVIVDWQDSFVSATRPAVMVAVVDNYLRIMTGGLLDQWQAIFRQDTNGDAILYLIVFDDEQDQSWDIQRSSISYTPLTIAFEALFSFSYFKHLYDPTYDGRDYTLPVSPGAPATMTTQIENNTRNGMYAMQDVVFTNSQLGTPATAATIQIDITNQGSAEVDVLRGGYYTYSPPNSSFVYQSVPFDIDTQFTVNVPVYLTFTATSPGVDVAWQNSGIISYTSIHAAGGAPDLTVDFTVVITDGTQGTNSTGQITLPSGSYTYDDGSLSWTIPVSDPQVLEPGGGSVTITNVIADTLGSSSALQDGEDITNLFVGFLPPSGITVTSTNTVNGMAPGTGTVLTVPAGTYGYRATSAGANVFYGATIPADIILQPGDISPGVVFIALTPERDPLLGAGLINTFYLDPRNMVQRFTDGVDVRLMSTQQGVDPVTVPTQVASQYFDFSLALAQLCKNNLALSWFWTMVKISYIGNAPSLTDKCYIRSRTRQEQLAGILDEDGIPSLLAGARDKFYWAMLHMMEAQNTTVIVHSEFVNLVPIILATWFRERNGSGTYIGNKLSLIRLSGSRIKPLGWPSWLDSSVNENDTGALQHFADMNVGHLTTISDNTPQESRLTMARGVGDPGAGLPTIMMMIARFCDYTCAQLAAQLVTDVGTLTNPVLNDEDTYQEIQRMVSSTLARFAATPARLFNITLAFPEFAQARKSRTALSAASAWRAWYQDDLDTIEVSGGIIAE